QGENWYGLGKGTGTRTQRLDGERFELQTSGDRVLKKIYALNICFLPVFPHLVKKLNASLHVMILIFLCAAISFALVSFGFCILNAIKVPYRAIKGPAGICLWNLLAASVKLHRLTERIANFQENVFQFVILEEQYESSIWLCVASATSHVVNLLLIAVSGVRFPEFRTKTEEATVTAEDIMY
uniref:Uncharacterized protein n=1 Tax=Gopherus agassizii TaxID=38772 RepID=A0A452GJH6_9SAUR